MLRVFSLAAFLMVAFAVSAEAQIISNPVLTSWAPYPALPSYTAPPTVMPQACCTPPAVSYGNACSPSSAATTAYHAPVVTTYRLRPTTTYYVPATTTYFAPTTAYYGSTTSYRVRTVPATTVYLPPRSTMPAATTSYYAPAIPSTSYYAPAAPPAYSAPAAPQRSCGCQGR